MEILKKTGKFLLGVVIGVAIMMFADRYYVKGKPAERTGRIC